MKRVWFTFKIIESILGLCCLGYHARGFLNITYIQSHYTYVAVFGGFSLMAMFGCLSICLKEPVSALREGLLNCIAAIAFILVSLNSMYHAEKDFHLMYLSADVADDIEEEHLEEVELTQPPHPFFKYSKAQSVAALCCGSLFLLHAILAFDLSWSGGGESFEVSDDDDEIDEGSIAEEGDKVQLRLPYYVFGKKVHEWLNHYEWFNSLADVTVNNKNNEQELKEVHFR
ncbi:uncharacterized protein LOC111682995 [Lucilia cuprina]|uniref:uncharacterized protein LOC111682995 n=1 Tax=Lucilia cuprina TaxID=7375 RepID=UPI001F05AC21|nr:uncharacterized protein LOC111682995 [Lucilia cuprina]